MASGSTQDDAQKQQQNLDIRTALNDAYAAVQGDKTNTTFNSISWEELANQQIMAISGPSTQMRPNQLDAIQRILNNLKQAVMQIKNSPPDTFLESDETRDVNTPP